MELPLLLAGVDVGEGQQLREDSQTVLDEALRSPANVSLHFFWDFVEVVEFVSDHPNEVADRFEVVFAVEVHL